MPTTEERLVSVENQHKDSKSSSQLDEVTNYDVENYHLIYNSTTGKIERMKANLMPLGSHKPYLTVASLPSSGGDFVAFVHSDTNPITNTTGNGYYVYEGGNWVKKSSEVENEINKANTTKAVSGSVVYKEALRLDLKSKEVQPVISKSQYRLQADNTTIYNSSGAIGFSEYHITKDGDEWSYSGAFGGSAVPAVFLDDNNNIIGIPLTRNSVSNVRNLKIKSPIGATKVRFGSTNSELKISLSQDDLTRLKLESLDAEIAKAQFRLETGDVTTYNSSGTLGVSRYYPTNYLDKWKYSGRYGGSALGAVFLDDNNEVLTELSNSTVIDVVDKEIISPENAALVRFSSTSGKCKIQKSSDILLIKEISIPSTTMTDVYDLNNIVVQDGDSLTDVALDDSYRYSFDRRFRGQFENNEIGWHNLDPRDASEKGVSYGRSGGWTSLVVTSDYSLKYAKYSFCGKGFYKEGSILSDYINWNTLEETWDKAELFYLRHPGGGSFEFNHEGSNIASVDTDGALGIASVEINRDVTKGYRANIRQCDGDICVYGIWFKNNTSKNAATVCMAKAGQKLARVGQIQSSSITFMMSKFKPLFYIMNIGMNDKLSGDFLKAEYKSSLITKVRAVRAGSPLTKIVLVCCNEPNDYATTNLPYYHEAIKEIAYEEGGILVVDIPNEYGNYQTFLSNGWMDGVDKTHPTPMFNSIYAIDLLRRLGINSIGRYI